VYREDERMTDWEQRYQRGDTPWDKGDPAPPLLELIQKKGTSVFGEGVVWVPGCGVGHDVRALARVGVQAWGVDLAQTAIERASAHPQVAEESFLIGDFLDAGWVASHQASAIWEHTCFCAIHPSRRDDYAASAARLLPSGGLLAGVFYLRPYDPGESNDGPPFGAEPDEIEAYFSPWFELEDSWIPEQAYPGREGREWLALFRRR